MHRVSMLRQCLHGEFVLTEQSEHNTQNKHDVDGYYALYAFGRIILRVHVDSHVIHSHEEAHLHQALGTVAGSQDA